MKLAGPKDMEVSWMLVSQLKLDPTYSRIEHNIVIRIHERAYACLQAMYTFTWAPSVADLQQHPGSTIVTTLPRP